jgi:hypothetical protein
VIFPPASVLERRRGTEEEEEGKWKKDYEKSIKSEFYIRKK